MTAVVMRGRARQMEPARWSAVGWVTVAILLVAAPALAVDGVIEINQTAVDAAGGFPYKITNAGSYRLTGNLRVTDPDVSAIDIQVENVTLDLNGFAITGPNTCTGVPPGLDCTAQGSGIGILAADNTRVMNGTIRGMGNDGISAGQRFYAERLSVMENGVDGISAGLEVEIHRCHVSRNGNDGIRVGAFSKVTGNVVRENNSEGIIIFSHTVVTHNTSNDNGTDGIWSNGGNCTIVENAFGSNTDDGIDAAGNDLIVNNVSTNNGGAQLEATSTTAYGGNLFSGATTVTGSPDQIATNSCNGNTVCP